MKRDHQPSTVRPIDEKSVSPAEDFLKTEYESLNQHMIHGEDTSHRIFNFYLSLLTAVLGGLVVVAQVFPNNFQGFLITAASASAFLILLGVVFFDGLTSQYIRNAYCHLSIQAIRSCFRQYEEVASSLLEPLTLFPEERIQKNGRSLTDRRMLVGMGSGIWTQLTLIESINSLLLVAVICCLVWGIGGLGFRSFDTILVATICGCVSFFAHLNLAKWKIKSNLTPMQSELDARIQTKKDSRAITPSPTGIPSK